MNDSDENLEYPKTHNSSIHSILKKTETLSVAKSKSDELPILLLGRKESKSKISNSSSRKYSTTKKLCLCKTSISSSSLDAQDEIEESSSGSFDNKDTITQTNTFDKNTYEYNSKECFPCLLTDKKTSILAKGFGMRNVASLRTALHQAARKAVEEKMIPPEKNQMLSKGFTFRKVASLEKALDDERDREYRSYVTKGFGLKSLKSMQEIIQDENKRQDQLLKSMKVEDDGKPPLHKVLECGFGIRTMDSLQRALLIDDERKRQLLKLLAQKAGSEEEEYSDMSSYASGEMSQFTLDFGSLSKGSMIKRYIDEIEVYDEEEGEEPFVVKEEDKKMKEDMLSAAMKKAQLYLKQHKIFEFFHFLTTQLLISKPENPIEFLLDLLNRCLLYRAGLGSPPLLYDRPHIERLFFLMDRMRTGFITLDQYKTGMRTIGICNFSKTPPLTSSNLVTQDYFVDEAYGCLLALFNDLIRRHWYHQHSRMLIQTPPPTLVSDVNTHPSMLLLSDGGEN